MQKLASKFVKPQIIHEHQSENQSLAQLDICLENQKDDMSLGISDPVVVVVVVEFMDYQAMSDKDIPQMIWDAAVVDVRDNQHRMDVIWGHLKTKLPSS